MNRTRCPWCGKRIDKDKDKIFWHDVTPRPAVPRMLRQANCGHCGHKYGQLPLFPYLLKIGSVVLLVVILAFIFQSVLLFLLAFVPFFFFIFMPYCKLDDKGNRYEENADLLCKFAIIDKYGKIKRDEMYFLNDCFDDFEPFVIEAPIRIYDISKNGDIILGEFLYMHKKNYDYIEKDNCVLYDTEMNPIAKIKFITESCIVS